MVYGRYNELVNGDYFMVYKPNKHHCGAPSCTRLVAIFVMIIPPDTILAPWKQTRTLVALYPVVPGQSGGCSWYPLVMSK